MLSMYPAHFYKEKEGGYSVIFPVIGGATCGDTLDEAMAMAIDYLAGVLYDLKLEGEPYPPVPSISELDPNDEYEDYESAFTSMVTVDVEEYARKNFERSVKKTLTIPSWLNDMATERNINFSQVLQNALKEQLHLQ